MQKISFSRKEKILFLDNFGSLINAGIPIVRALQIIYFQSENKHIQEMSAYFKQAIESGKNIIQVCESLPRIFSPFDRAMFEMGEATGKIGQVLTLITEREEKQQDLESKIKQALIYPASIMVVAIGMVVTIMTYVVPKIEKIYHDSHVNLPPLTQFIIGMSHFLRGYGVYLAIALVAGVVGFLLALRNPRFRYEFDRRILSLPIFGGILRKKILIVFTEFLATLLNAGILINRSLSIVRTGMDNRYYEMEIDAVLSDIKAGKTLSSALGGEYIERKIRGETIGDNEIGFKRKVDCFPIELSMSVKIGEQTGSLARMLEKMAVRYNKEVDVTIKGLSSMIEPIIIVGIGGIVGVIIMAIMLPFFNMVNVIH
ncbi:MAG: type II secretion system F family protein [Candidatus Gracilibacteria bacterium]|nr:type II secretion system F family protein [Candidatus Gracilibacteria bacterium]